MGSIVVILATDAPLLPHQCQRLAQRASIGVARTGGGTEDSSGDVFLAFATGNQDLPPADYARKDLPQSTPLRMLNNDHISPLFAAAARRWKKPSSTCCWPARTCAPRTAGWCPR